MTLQAVEKILIVGPAWVGDMVMAQSLFIGLKQQNPNCQIDVLAPVWAAALLERMPEVERVYPVPFAHGKLSLKVRIGLGLQLRKFAYQRAIVLPNSWKSAVVPFFAAIPLRTGYIGEVRWGLLNDARRLDKKRLKKTVERFVALGKPREAPLPPVFQRPKLVVSPARQNAVCEKYEIVRSARILAICPGAEFGPAKRWPVEHFAEVARKMYEVGWQVWIFGSEKDRDVAQKINELASGHCRNFAGETSLGEAVDLLSHASVVLSNDSGLMHVAAALDIKLVAVYGSSDPDFTPPLHPAAVVVSIKLDCAPCFQRVCPFGHTRCLREISPDSILSAIGS